MRTSAALLVAAALSFPAAARAASEPAPYDAKLAPLDELSKSLLTVNGYELRDDGRVWDKIGDAPVAKTDMPYLLSRLASAKRLRALLEINNIITRYDAERKLSPEDKEAVRALVRDNWIVFGIGPRNDFRSYFSAEELAALDRIPPRFESMTATTLTDPAVESVTAGAPAATLQAPPKAPAVAASTSAAVVAPAVARSTAPTTSFTVEQAAAPKLPVIVPAPAAPSTSSVVSPDAGQLKVWTGPAVSSATLPAPPKPAPAAAPEPPKAAAVGEAEYAKFVADGPYSKESKAALELIEKRAPDFCLPLLRRAVVGAVPQIVVDGARTGAELRAGFARDAADPLAPARVALSPGPAYVEVKKGFFGSRETVLLPEAAEVWAEFGVPRPALDALREGASPDSTENGDWGAARVFADGSRRGTYSISETAGELLEQLLLLGLAREGLDASAYAARRWARTARLMFYARLKDETQRDDFLDPERRAELRGWLDRPEETDDVTAAVWSGSRLQLLDPRRGPPAAELDFDAAAGAACVRAALENALAENSRRRAARVGALETLVDAGVLDAAAAKAAAQAATDAEEAERRRLLAKPPSCPEADAARAEGLRKSGLLLAESTRAERLMRERRAGVDSHAP
ncbi:MAG: hypothetical protein ACHQ49_06900 [Elusimicrobiota bacterium]